MRHEDISRDPAGGFRSLYDRLDLTLSSRAMEAIDEFSAPANPADPDAPVGSEAALKRDSRKNAWNWKSRLVPREVDAIRGRVEEISAAFYSDEDW